MLAEAAEGLGFSQHSSPPHGDQGMLAGLIHRGEAGDSAADQYEDYDPGPAVDDGDYRGRGVVAGPDVGTSVGCDVHQRCPAEAGGAAGNGG